MRHSVEDPVRDEREQPSIRTDGAGGNLGSGQVGGADSADSASPRHKACPSADSNGNSIGAGRSSSLLSKFRSSERLDRRRSNEKSPTPRPPGNGNHIALSAPSMSESSPSALPSVKFVATEGAHRCPSRLTFEEAVAAVAAAIADSCDPHCCAVGSASAVLSVASSDSSARSPLGSRSSDSGSVSCAVSQSSSSSPDASVADVRSLQRRRRESRFGSSGSENGFSYQQGDAWRQRRAERELIKAYSHPIPERNASRRLYFTGRSADAAVAGAAGNNSKQEKLLLTAEQRQYLRVLESLCDGEDFDSAFSLGEVLYHGGPYGSAYTGVDKRDGSRVAVQLVDVGRHLDDLYTLCSELLATSHLRHASLADHVGSYFSSDLMRLWIVSELVEDGVALRRTFSDAPPDDDATALIARECVRLAQSLQHEAFTHRRLGVDSVYVCADGGIRVCRVGCCSHAWSSSGANLRAGESMHYSASPEQIKRKPHSRKADSWSVGILIYELLQGDRPYRDLTEDKALLKTARSGVRKCVREVEASHDVKNFIGRCLKRRPIKRASIDEVARHPFLRRAPSSFSDALFGS